MLVICSHPLKAPSPIRVMVFGIDTPSSNAQPANAFLAISSTPLGIEYLVVRLEQRIKTVPSDEYRSCKTSSSKPIWSNSIGSKSTPFRSRVDKNGQIAAIEEAINRHGGSITIDDTIDLQLARKP